MHRRCRHDRRLLQGAIDALRHGVAGVMAVTAWPILIYFILINTSFLVLIGLAALEFARHMRRMPFADLEAVAASPLTLPVSVLVPAYNEEVGIVPAVQAMLALRYPQHEVVVVDDGSKDGTAQALIEAFDLVEVPIVVPQDVPDQGPAAECPRAGRRPHPAGAGPRRPTAVGPRRSTSESTPRAIH